MQDTIRAMTGLHRRTASAGIHAVGPESSGGHRPLAMLDKEHWRLMRTRDETRARKNITADIFTGRMLRTGLQVGRPIRAINGYAGE